MMKCTLTQAVRSARAGVLTVMMSCVTLAQEPLSEAEIDLVRPVAEELFTASQFTVEPAAAAFVTKRIGLERFTSDLPACENLGAVRAVNLGNSHSAKFIVATDGAIVFRLGGVASPDVSDFVSTVQRGPHQMDLLGLSRCLARLLDPHAGLQVIALGDSTSPASSPALDSVGRRWLDDRARSQFADEVVERPDGSHWVRVNVLSGTDGYGGWNWTWRSYVFLFDGAGHLRHWHVRVSDPVLLP